MKNILNIVNTDIIQKKVKKSKWQSEITANVLCAVINVLY